MVSKTFCILINIIAIDWFAIIKNVAKLCMWHEVFFSYLNFERQWLLILYTMNNAVWKNTLII